MEIRPFASADLDAVVRVWHAAKREAYGFLAQEQGRTLEEDCAFFSSRSCVTRWRSRRPASSCTRTSATIAAAPSTRSTPCGRVRFGVSPPPESEPDIEYHWRPDSRK